MAEKILIISPVPLFPGHAGNRERIRAICAELMSRGYVLDFFYTGFHKDISDAHQPFFNGTVLEHSLKSEKVRWTENPLYRIRELFQGLKVKTDRWFRYIADGADSARFNKSLKEYQNVGKQLLLENQVERNSYKAVIVNYAPYSFYFDLFNDKTVKIIDTHDRLTDRFKLFLENNKDPVDWHSLRKKDEERALTNAALIWAITEEERNYFAEMLTNSSVQVYTLRHLIPYSRIKKREPTKTIVMIGSSNRLNIDGLTWFLEQVWQKIKHYEFDLKFLVAGSICEAVDASTLEDNVELYGRFESPDEIYSKGDLFINPMQEGTGLKIKTFEALAHGKFVLSTESGATGLQELRGHGLICSEDSATWIQVIKNFFMNEESRTEELEKAGKIIETLYQENLKVITQSLEFKK